jgi:hypothetical protein
MAREDVLDSIMRERDPRPPVVGRPGTYMRTINQSWASITDSTLLPGELVYNADDDSLVYRAGHDTIFRFDNAETRTI